MTRRRCACGERALGYVALGSDAGGLHLCGDCADDHPDWARGDLTPYLSDEQRDAIRAHVNATRIDAVREFVSDFTAWDPWAEEEAAVRDEATSILVASVDDGINPFAMAVAFFARESSS